MIRTNVTTKFDSSVNRAKHVSLVQMKLLILLTYAVSYHNTFSFALKHVSTSNTIADLPCLELALPVRSHQRLLLTGRASF